MPKTEHQVETATKRCKKCGEDLPLKAFQREALNRDGLRGSCKACHRVREMAWRHANRDRVAKTQQRWRSRRGDPEKVRARNAVSGAVKRGELRKPERCEQCGAEAESHRIHGHHHDYSKPLDVEWLCVGCHLAAHGKKAARA